jgi:pimeloyl-ACP methyl ester carboxylesterase
VFPLPKPLERLLMERLVRDAHHYLYAKTFEPRPGERFDVQRELRTRFVDALRRGAARPGPLVVVSHSMGTIIAYDCLRRVDDTPKVDGLITLGSPLGLSEVQDGWGKEWSSRNGFPVERVPRAGWFNFYDRLDVVCAADPELGNDYRLEGDTVVNDVRVRNSGSWRHYIREYLARDQVRDALRGMLEM